MRKQWYLSTPVICLAFAFWIFIIPPIVGVVLLVLRFKQERFNKALFNGLNSKLLSYEERNDEIQNEHAALSAEIAEMNTTIPALRTRVASLQTDVATAERQQQTQVNKLRKIKELYKSMEHSIDTFFNYPENVLTFRLPDADLQEAEELAPSVMLKLHCMDVKDLQKAYRENDKQIDALLSSYAKRYTTKANAAIYNLMVIALRSELQNILINLRYEKLDNAVEQVQNMTAKYLSIAGAGNQSIAGTLTKFIGEVEYLFINAVKIEYNYYVKKEQARQEQLAIREQMKQEAEERKALEAEKKKIEKEESKYTTEIEKLSEQLGSAAPDEQEQLQARILELQSQLADVVLKKDEIASLANGKAGNVYIISNLGSFGEDVFKIGMTRRLDPAERVNELGNASVPFRFDVHSFIFSDDAVSLEAQLHEKLNANRVNKVNLRKEFFRVSLDELEELVQSIDPTAEFTRTMAAEEYRQSLSTDEIYTSDETFNDEDE